MSQVYKGIVFTDDFTVTVARIMDERGHGEIVQLKQQRPRGGSADRPRPTSLSKLTGRTEPASQRDRTLDPTKSRPVSGEQRLGSPQLRRVDEHTLRLEENVQLWQQLVDPVGAIRMTYDPVTKQWLYEHMPQ